MSVFDPRRALEAGDLLAEQAFFAEPQQPDILPMLEQRGIGPDIGRALLAALEQMPPPSRRQGAGGAFLRGLASGYGTAAVRRDNERLAENERRTKVNEQAQKDYSQAARDLRERRTTLWRESRKPQAAAKEPAPAITVEEAKRMGHPEFAGMTREDARLMLNAKDAKSGEVTPTSRLGFINTLTDNARLDMRSWGNVRDGYRRLLAGARVASGPGDLALIFSYMKILDPDSTIMPSEYKNAAEAVGMDQRLRNVPAWALEGDKLSPQGRKWFIEAGRELYKQRLADAKETLTQYRAQASEYGIDPKLAIGRFERMILNDEALDAARATPAVPAAPAGPREFPQAGRRRQ